MKVTGEDIDEIFEKVSDNLGIDESLLETYEGSNLWQFTMVCLAVLEWYEETHVKSDTNK